ncbi:MAG: hypothetical protein IJA99_05435 [Oscillospiraceae bacterium]|nr:hypothetical protein [Oscillospiraceae bacterium]
MKKICFFSKIMAFLLLFALFFGCAVSEPPEKHAEEPTKTVSSGKEETSADSQIEEVLPPEEEDLSAGERMKRFCEALCSDRMENVLELCPNSGRLIETPADWGSFSIDSAAFSPMGVSTCQDWYGNEKTVETFLLTVVCKDPGKSPFPVGETSWLIDVGETWMSLNPAVEVHNLRREDVSVEEIPKGEYLYQSPLEMTEYLRRIGWGFSHGQPPKELTDEIKLYSRGLMALLIEESRRQGKEPVFDFTTDQLEAASQRYFGRSVKAQLNEADGQVEGSIEGQGDGQTAEQTGLWHYYPKGYLYGFDRLAGWEWEGDVLVLTYENFADALHSVRLSTVQYRYQQQPDGSFFLLTVS